MMKKRILSMILALCILCTMPPALVLAADEIASGTCGEHATWSLSSDYVLTISGIGNMDAFLDMEENWKSYGDSITGSVIEEGITNVGDYAFAACPNLTFVQIPESVTSIGQGAFRECAKLTEVILPAGLTEIKGYAFSDCSSLTSVEIPAGVKEIPNNAFRLCTGLTDVTLSEGLVELGFSAFYKCTGLTSITFPKTLRTIDNALNQCMNLTELYFKGDAPESIVNESFYLVTATAYYPVDNSTWSDNVIKDYGGTLTWVPWCPDGCVYESAATEATCIEPSGLRYTCSACGDTYVETDNKTPALGHKYEDGLCIRCGDAQIKVTTPEVTAENIKSSGKIRLTWNAVNGAVGYHVYYSTDKGESYELLKKVSGTSLNHISAKVGKTYYYHVLAIDKAGNESVYDKNKVAWCTATIKQPVISLSNVASTGKVRISWEKVNGASRYSVYVSEDGGKSYSHLSSTPNTSIVDTYAKPGVKYRYKVMAEGENENGGVMVSAYSAAKDRTCDLARPTIKLSSAPTGKNKVSWNHVEGAVKYEVYRSTDGGKTYRKLSTTSKNYIVNTSSELGKTYYYKVKAIAAYSAANSAFSTAKSRTVGRPGPEVTITLTTSGKPRLTWDTISGATKYKVYCSTDGGLSFKLLKTTTEKKLTHTSAEDGNIYQYVVKAVIGDETRTSPVVIGPCVRCDISGSKSVKSVITRINEYRDEYGIPALKWYVTGLNAAKIRAAEMNDGYTRTEEQQLELIETYNCYLELDFQADSTSKEFVDTIMYNYYDYASFFMYEGFTYAVAARKGDCWAIMFG